MEQRHTPAGSGRSVGGRDELTAAYEEAVAQLGGLLLDGPSLQALLGQLLEIARTAAPRLDAASVTAVGDDGRLATASTTSPEARAIDEREYELDEGPCVAALQTGQEQLVADVRTDERWPEFNERAAELGFRCVAGLPLTLRGTTIGALDLFARRPGGLDEPTLATMRRLTRPLSAALANARAYRRTEQLTRDLQGRLEGLADTNQAIGVLMAQRNCDAATAVALLERTAETTGRSREDVVRQVLRSVQS